MQNWKAWSMVMFRSMISFLGTLIVYPVTGIGDVGTRILTRGTPADAVISSRLSPVTKPSDQMPLRGYSIATIRLYSIVRSVKRKSVTCLTDE